MTLTVTVYVLTVAVKLAVTVTFPVTVWGTFCHSEKAKVYCAVAWLGVAVTSVEPIVRTFPDAETEVP